MSIFSDRLTECLTSIEMSQKTLAKKTEITPATISRYITSQRNPTAENANRISKVLNTSVDYLLGCSDNNPLHILNTDSELLEFTTEHIERKSMQLLFNRVKSLSNSDIEKIIKFIDIIEDKTN